MKSLDRLSPPLLLGLAGFLLHGVFASAPLRDLCPETCLESGPEPSNWTVVAEIGQLEACKRPLILEFSLNMPVTTKQHIRACNIWADDFPKLGDWHVPTSSISNEDVVPQLAWTPAASQDEDRGRLASQSVEHLQSYLNNSRQPENRIMLFATVSGTTVGVYVGANLLNPSVAESFFGYFFSALHSVGIADSKAALVQVCEDRTSDNIFGLIAAASIDFTTVHKAVSQWSNGKCVDTSSYTDTLQLNTTTIAIVQPIIVPNPGASNDTIITSFSAVNSTVRGLLRARADCRVIEVKSGNGCGDLVSRCGGGLTAQNFYKYNPASNLCSTLQPGMLVCCTSGTLPVPPEPQPNADGTCRTEKVDGGDDCGKLVSRCGGGLTAQNFYKYNPASSLCSTLQPGQRVCCTPGKLPDIRPKKNADGSCFAYQIKGGDFCSKIAAANGLTVKELEDMNKNTWGWNGCENGFWPENWMCLSEGTPPFPAPIANAVCGPQKPGSVKPSGSESKDWAKLNPCPLNACCNIWGQCGTTVDFCIDTNTGPPGTAKKDTYGCISNCGMTIIQSSPPAQFIKLGYFEGFNLGSRDCLNMDASQIDPSYTHIHFAFGMINNNFEIYQENKLAEFQFQQFKKLVGPKRIISFGGWVFSAEAPNYPIFRNGVKPENRNKLADNLVKYVVDNGLDGLDLDWEYPSAPDLPGIPQGDVSEALDYLRLLALLRAKLPKGKSLSIAAPASFWYLKQFPIKAMSELLDYIVYMTYDLHGQWDAGNKWASPGCPSGNCLRSHINRTETMGALTMITKAGVPSNKVLVGVSSYGRSFQMVDPSCTGPNCLFTGDRTTSYARKGRCTKTGGYISNAELGEINGRTWIDPESNSKIMVDGDLWVSYMDDSLKESRTQMYKRYSMGGTIDWAVDLAKFHEPPNFGLGDIGLKLGWAQVKSNIMIGQSVTCNRGLRTGNWVKKECTMHEVAGESMFTPKERWEALECQAAWEDAVRVWFGCTQGPENYGFSEAMAEFLHQPGTPDCGNLALETKCGRSSGCKTHNTGADLELYHTGACTYEIWNSIAELHIMIKNYRYSLETTGNSLKSLKDEFISTFAPKPEDGTELLSLFLTLSQIPLGIAGARFFGSSLMGRAFFAGDTSGKKKAAWETATMGLVNTGFGIAQEELKKASEARSEIAFNAIFDELVGSWKGQTDKFIKKIFDGSEDSVNILTNLFRDGQMISGKADGPGKVENDHTESWNRERAIERAFYAAAIPAAWAANKPTPVVVDFGPSCKIDARKYFTEQPSQYNVGWRCVNGHSYILAGVRDGPPQQCGSPVPGSQCTPQSQWTLEILKGIDEIQEPVEKWGRITVDDLIIGAVNTYERAGNKNSMNVTENPPSPSDKDAFESYQDIELDVRRGGYVRIPICGAEEAKANLAKGRKTYGDSPNYPCNP